MKWNADKSQKKKKKMSKKTKNEQGPLALFNVYSYSSIRGIIELSSRKYLRVKNKKFK